MVFAWYASMWQLLAMVYKLPGKVALKIVTDSDHVGELLYINCLLVYPVSFIYFHRLIIET